MLIENTLFGVVDKVQIAICRSPPSLQAMRVYILPFRAAKTAKPNRSSNEP